MRATNTKQKGIHSLGMKEYTIDDMCSGVALKRSSTVRTLRGLLVKAMFTLNIANTNTNDDFEPITFLNRWLYRIGVNINTYVCSLIESRIANVQTCSRGTEIRKNKKNVSKHQQFVVIVKLLFLDKRKICTSFC